MKIHLVCKFVLSPVALAIVLAIFIKMIIDVNIFFYSRCLVRLFFPKPVCHDKVWLEGVPAITPPEREIQQQADWPSTPEFPLSQGQGEQINVPHDNTHSF